MNRKCERCGKPYEAGSYAAKYCDDCRKAVRREVGCRCYQKKKLKLVREILSADGVKHD